MNLTGGRQSTNVGTRTSNRTYDGNDNRVRGPGQSGQLTRNGKTYDSRGRTYGDGHSSNSGNSGGGGRSHQ